MNTRLNGAVAVGVTALGATAAVFGVAGLLAFGPRHEVAPVSEQHSTTEPACVVLCDHPAAPTPAGGCVLFCSEPGLPLADEHGCQLFCDLNAPKEGEK
ncbi:hypothetical protein C5E44_29380 [Nocardia nova]|uniref:hypothetical protein n=1 Tax=Nocardia nova TaxID=37330 RepID=UPI000CE9B04A|nr:hypothetical protein C5E44_29380 [Nocardia nova]